MNISKFFRWMLLLPLCGMTEQVCAQNGTLSFPTYSAYMSDVFDISWKGPKGFTCSEAGLWNSQEKGSESVYNFVFRSEDGDCAIMYPDVDLNRVIDGTKKKPVVRRIYEELGCIGENGSLKEDASGEFAKQVTVLSGDDAKKLFRADTVYVCAIPLQQPYQGKYPYCTGIYVSKQNRPTLCFKCFFTEKGKQKEDGYLGKLYKAVGYRNENWTFDEEKYLQEFYRLRLKRGEVE